MNTESRKHPEKNYMPGFQFNQGNLQDYVECARLFQLRHIKRIHWPFREQELSQQYREYMHLGTVFHQMIYQFYLGIPSNHLIRTVSSDQKLIKWWEDFLTYRPELDNYHLYPEISLSIPIGTDRLVAKFDLLASKQSEHNSLQSGKQEIIIIDWKTSKKQSKQSWLVKRLQSRVYPYLIVEASPHFMGGRNVEPDKVSMIYWNVNYPTKPQRISYNDEMFLIDKTKIHDLINSIKSIDDHEAPKTENLKRCKYCEYQSLCNRWSGDDVNDDEIEADHELSLDFLESFDYDQIAEIEF